MPLCLAADNKNSQGADIRSISKTDGVQAIFTQVMASQKDCEKELAWAYSLGFFMGKKDNIHFPVTHSNVIGVVVPNFIQAFQSASDSVNAEDAISKLFNKQLISNLAMLEDDYIEFAEFRKMFSGCAHDSVSMVSLDLAILNWLVKVIKALGKECSLMVDRNLLMPLSALTMHSHLGKHCTGDVLTVLTSVQKWLLTSISSSVSPNFSILLTLIKILDDGLIRMKVKEMATELFLKEDDNYFKSLLLLGPEDSFVMSVKELLLNGKRTQCKNEFHQQLEGNIIVHSLGDSSLLFFGHSKHLFLFSSDRNYLCANISEDSLNWEMNDSIMA